MSARVRSIHPSPSSRTPVKRYQAGCIQCDWFGNRYVRFQTAVNQMGKHNDETHVSEASEGREL